jgi:tetratricopeptide (TPR) repeat protein
MLESLAHLASVAQKCESVDDERFALSQLVMIAPHEVKYADRLKEINEQFGYDDEATENLFDSQFMKAPMQAGAAHELETFASLEDDVAFESEGASSDFGDFAIVGANAPEVYEISEPVELPSDDDDERLLREVDSIKFYIDSGYLELAEKAINELRSEFGDRAEIEGLRLYLQEKLTDDAPEETAVVDPMTPAIESMPSEPEPAVVVAPTNGNGASSPTFAMHDLRSELGIDEADVADDDSDYDTHYHTAVAYQEMGLLDEAIKEFQDAVSLVHPNDPTRRFFQCANLLGHCFMQKAMPNLALTWFRRALETPGLNEDEKQGIWYELAAAYEAEGDLENAGRYFEQVYAENIDFRDVSERVKNISVGR